MSSKLKYIFKYLFSEKINLCTLCFTSIHSSEHFLNITDQVIFNSEFEMNLLEILNFVLSPYNTNGFITNRVCQKCGELALSSYLFLKKFRDNINYISNIIEIVTYELKTSKDENLEYVKAMYLLHDNTNKLRKYYDTKSDLKSVSEAKVRLKSIFENQNEDEANIISIELMPELETKSLECNNQKLKRKRQRCDHSPIDAMSEKDAALNIKCILCSKIFPTQSNFRQHYIRVHGPKTIKCPKCPKYFGSNAILKQHQSESHLEAICSTCGKIYNNQHYLKMHELSHKISYKCELCNRVYKTQQTFNTHLSMNICSQSQRKSHSDVRFTCDICNKQFCHKASLKSHIKVAHENCTTYKCNQCNKKFSAPSRLNAHMVKHTHLKNFPCNICGSRFVSKESLTYHIRIHTGERPYKCTDCDEAFISSSRRSLHIKRRHRILKCPVCNGQFKSKLKLEHHEKASTCRNKIIN